MSESTPLKPPANPWSSRFGRICAIVGAGLIAGVIAASAGGVASAQAVVEADDLAEPSNFRVTFRQMQDEAGEGDLGSGAILDRFEQCLEEAGIELEEMQDQGKLDTDSIEGVFEKCDLILDELDDDSDFSFDFGDDPHVDLDFEDGNFNFDFGDGFELDIDLGLSPEDAAVFEEYETCLGDAGVTFDGWFDDIEDLDERDFDDIEEAFETCEPLLDDLSIEVQELFGDCPEDHDEEEGDEADQNEIDEADDE